MRELDWLERQRMTIVEILARYNPAPPTMVSTPVDPDHPLLPTTARQAVRAARARGLSPRVYRAAGLRAGQYGVVGEVHTLGVRVDVGGVKIAMLWAWKADAWSFDGAWISPGRPTMVEGATFALPVEAVGARVAMDLIKS